MSDSSPLMGQSDSGDLREFVARWKASFGGGLVPFDTAYHDALRQNATTAEAQRAGVHALLDALVETWEARRDRAPMAVRGTWDGGPADVQPSPEINTMADAPKYIVTHEHRAEVAALRAETDRLWEGVEEAFAALTYRDLEPGIARARAGVALQNLLLRRET